MIIYKCTNLLSNKSYIGKTIRSIDIRKQEHLKELRNNIKGGLWQLDFNTYGDQNFKFEVLEQLDNHSALLYREKQLIKELNTLEPNGYNKTTSSGPEYSIDKLVEISKHTLDTLELIMLLSLSLPYKEIAEIARESGVTDSVVSDLLRCKSYTWLATVSPSLYNEIVYIHKSKCTRSTYLKSLDLIHAMDLYVNTELSDKQIADICNITVNILRDIVRQKAYLSLSEVAPEMYSKAIAKYSEKNTQRIREKTIIDTSTDTWYTFNTCAEGERLTGIDHRRLSDLVSGRTKKYKTFILI